jgi:hypothetical protein
MNRAKSLILVEIDVKVNDYLTLARLVETTFAQTKTT